jgi:hypothetical protein
MKMKVTVDRIENDIAVMLIRPEEKNSIEIPLKYIPGVIEEGDILTLVFKRKEDNTEDAKKRVDSLLNKLKNKNS